jgi:hypothetical protein
MFGAEVPEGAADSIAAPIGADADPDATFPDLASIPLEVRAGERDQLVVRSRNPRSAPRPGRLLCRPVQERRAGLDRDRDEVGEQRGSLFRVVGREGSNGCDSATLGARGAIAQLGERLDRTQEVAGSSPASSIFRRVQRRKMQAPPSRRREPGRHSHAGGGRRCNQQCWGIPGRGRETRSGRRSGDLSPSWRELTHLRLFQPDPPVAHIAARLSR